MYSTSSEMYADVGSLNKGRERAGLFWKMGLMYIC